MNKGQLGKNMKPRGINRSEDTAATDEPAEEGHRKAELDQDLGPKYQVLPDDADTTLQVAEIHEQSPEEKLAAETSIVAVTDMMEHFMAPPEDAEVVSPSTAPLADNLAELMRKSRSQQYEEQPQVGTIVLPTSEEIEAIETGDRLPIVGGAFGEGEFDGSKPGSRVVQAPAGLGQQPNGDYGVLVLVPEQLVSGVLGQAEMDGVSPSEWLSVRMGDFLEGWFHGK